MTDNDKTQDSGLDVETLETSFAAIAPHAERLVERFYVVLFERYPGVEPLFEQTDPKSQQGKLLAALKLVVANVRNTEVLVPALQEMGRRHQHYGAQPDHYVAVAEVLITVMAEIAGDAWTEQMQKSWSDALAVIAEVMIGAYADASVDGDPPQQAGPPEGIERRSADRPWTGPKDDADTVDESADISQGKKAQS